MCLENEVFKYSETKRWGFQTVHIYKDTICIEVVEREQTMMFQVQYYRLCDNQATMWRQKTVTTKIQCILQTISQRLKGFRAFNEGVAPYWKCNKNVVTVTKNSY